MRHKTGLSVCVLFHFTFISRHYKLYAMKTSGYFYILAFVIYAIAAPTASADYASLQASDCALLLEFTGPAGLEKLINTNSDRTENQTDGDHDAEEKNPLAGR